MFYLLIQKYVEIFTSNRIISDKECHYLQVADLTLTDKIRIENIRDDKIIIKYNI